MNKNFLVGYLLLIIALVMIILNLISGLQLSNDIGQSPTTRWHLIQGIGLLVLSIAANITLLRASQAGIEKLVRQNLQADSNVEQKINRLSILKQKATPFSIICLILAPIGLITGTISHAGQFPILHGLLGIALAICTLIAIILWTPGVNSH